MAMIKINVVCKCGKVLATKNVNSSGKFSGSLSCSNCKKIMKYEIIDGKCYTHIKK